ncbi:amino acid adenylation domain-containing protein [Actinosynnema sp. NPDC047251]|uniref:Non-ribosomal peptide synthetase n=1 Tax=Saccharothrix espanaensis (strain ATCC 51144 / DSM 44229 / JCM 9112 / NBRC 15066 / NRRL 15764) TaxID=1179773 RepID=K0K6Q0_SACES|nr:amino acid adenylation domain-containing protein [Saccharothrix espanaensis]CCH32569.1 Non-ribosomal peptide synthetase [Saccharothrix espanaensis DSM 44229]
MSRNLVLDEFEQSLRRDPDHAAVVDRDRVVSYRELAESAGRIAAWLSCRGVGRGDLIPLVGERSVDLIAATVGVSQCGAAYVPVDAAYPAERRESMIAQCRPKAVLSAACGVDDNIGAAVDVRTILAEARDPRPGPVEIGGGDSVYVIFTSGTTGVPKGVVVEHRALARLIEWHNRRFAMGPDCRSTLMVGVGFDVSQWEIWSALTSGATIHVVDEEVRAEPAALLDFYAEHGLTHAYAPTALVHGLADAPQPSSLRLRYLFCAGEKLHPLATAHLPYKLVDYYGPTEATIYATYRVVPPHSEHEPSSIGVPVADTEAFVLDDVLDDVPPGDVGELCLAGAGLARGYLGSPRLTARRFVHSRRLGRRLYRTGDLARRLPDGTLQFVGRRDEQIKIRGYRVEPGDVEAALLKHPGVRAAAVVAEADEEAAQRLFAFLVPGDPAEAEDRLVADVRAGLRRELPDFMRPAVYRLLTELPTAASGKTDYPALRQLTTTEEPSEEDEEDEDRFDNDVERGIASVWCEVLGHRHFSADDDFAEVGGNSMLVASTVEQISARTGMKTRIRDLYEFPSVRALATELRKRATQDVPGGDGEPVHELQRDIQLPPGFAVTGNFDPDVLTRPRHILLTGATGFVGIHLLAELLATTRAHLHLPVRGSDAAHVTDRLRRVARRYQVDLDLDRISVHPADLAEPRWGVADEDYRRLTEQVDVVYHSASAVNFIQPYSYLKRDNVDGLRQVVAFAAEGRTKALILLSTISVFSWGHLFTGKTRMREDDDIDQNLPAVSTDLGYVRSKWVMEKIADLAAERGLPLMTFRLGYATCHSRTGLSADYQWWGRLVQTCTALNAIPDLRELREGLTTVDYMAQAIAAVSRRPQALGRRFNLVPSPEQAMTLKEFFHLVGRQIGQDFAVLPYRQWVSLWEHDPTAPLYPLRGMFTDDMHEGQSTIELYQNTYRWETDDLRHHLAPSGIREPEFTPDLLTRYLDRLHID